MEKAHLTTSTQLNYQSLGAYTYPNRFGLMAILSIVIASLGVTAYLVMGLSGVDELKEARDVELQNEQQSAQDRQQAQQMDAAAAAVESRPPSRGLTAEEAEMGIEYINRLRQEYHDFHNFNPAPLSPKQHDILVKIMRTPGQTLYDPSMKLPEHAERSGWMGAWMEKSGDLWINLGHQTAPNEMYSYSGVIGTDGSFLQPSQIQTPADYYRERARVARDRRPAIDGPSYDRLLLVFTELGTGVLLSVLLLVGGIALLRHQWYATRMHRLYAYLQILLSVVLTISLMSLSFDGPAGPELDLGVVGLILGLAGCVYPVLILLILRKNFDIARSNA